MHFTLVGQNSCFYIIQWHRIRGRSNSTTFRSKGQYVKGHSYRTF